MACGLTDKMAWPTATRRSRWSIVTALFFLNLSVTARAQLADFGSAHTVYGQTKIGNVQRFTILPSVRFSYETNALPYTDRSLGGERDNVRITPGIDISILRFVGSTQLSLNGSAGYDLNSRYRFFNQPRVNLSSGVQAPITGKCDVIGGAAFSQFQLNQSDLTQTSNARLRSQNYDLSARCDRSVGLSPVIGIGYSKQTTNDFAIYNFEDLTYRVGLSYYLPTLGRLTLSGNAEQLNRPRIKDFIGQADSTKVREINLVLNRSVSPRLQAKIGIGYFSAIPNRQGVNGTSGLSYDTVITWIPKPRLSLSAIASRRISNESGINATYARVEQYEVTTNWQISKPSSIQMSVDRTYRSFNGEDILAVTVPIRDDRVDQLSLNYSIDTLTRLRISAGIRHLWRSGGNAIYNYQSTIVSGSIGARF